MGRVRIARTRDGRFVPDTDLEAAVLVYAGDEDKAPPEALAKMRDAAPNKQRKRRARNKAKPTAAAPEQESSDGTAPAQPPDESATE